MASNQANRFQSLDSSVEEFIDGQENENTKKKTKHDVALFHEFLVLKGETRQMDELTPQELNKFLSEFLITVRKKEDNEEYEPNSLRAFFASFERHLKKKNHGLCLMKDVQFEQTRKALQSKQRDLKRKGKGNKPNASAALSEEDVQVLYEKDLLGSSTAEALLNTVWFNNTIHFGLRGCKEHREMCWGDVKLCQTSTGQEYLEFNERETKTCSGNDPRNVRAIAPKMFAVPNIEKCPSKAYKVYAEKRPAEMKTDDAPFYLAVNNVKSGSGKPWFKKAPVGVNKLNTLMKTMAQKAGLGPNFKNHSGRKTMIQTLVNNDVPPTDIMQLSGHKNVQSITSYSTVSQKQQLNMSHTLTGLSSREIAPQSGSCIPEKRKHEFDELTYPTFRPTFSQQSKQAAQQPLSLFSGAVISGGHISVAINTLNQSPTLSVREENPSKTYKRIKPLDSDSD